jgi:hypothetical protein
VKARIAALGVLALAGFVLAGCSEKAEDPEPPTGVKAYPTPEAVCDAFFAAVERRDFRTAVACLAQESIKRMSRDFAWQGLARRDENLKYRWAKDRAKPHRRRLSEEEEEARRRYEARLSEVLDRHGLTPRVADDLKAQPTEQAAQEALPALIRDPAGFVADYLALTHKTDPRWQQDKAPRPRLDDVTIAADGRSAEGEVVFRYSFVDKGERRDNKQPMKFVKRGDGGWRIVLSSARYIVP